MITASLLHELRDFDTPLLANTIGYLSKTPPHEYYLSGEIQSVTPPLGPTVGVAFTAEIDSSTPGGVGDTELYWEQLEVMRQSAVPMIWVVKAVGSRPEHECMIGDGMAKTLFSVGCVGLVSDSRVRDVTGLITTPFAAYCRGRAVHHGPLRIRATNRPVEIGGVIIHPGDVIHADQNGVIRIPADCIENLAAAAIRNRAFEHEAHMFLRRTDRTPAEKRAQVQALVRKYAFNDCVSGGPPPAAPDSQSSQ
ncbi:MAG: RraA family protein [Prosthecobacter sp.]|nr:RraA family protein [Prosthecobacter sp.]